MANSCKKFPFDVKHSSRRPSLLLQASSRFHVVFVPSWAPDTARAANFPKNTIQPHGAPSCFLSLFLCSPLSLSCFSSSNRTQPSFASPGTPLQQQHLAFVSKCQVTVCISRRNCPIHFCSSCLSKSGNIDNYLKVSIHYIFFFFAVYK